MQFFELLRVFNHFLRRFQVGVDFGLNIFLFYRWRSERRDDFAGDFWFGWFFLQARISASQWLLLNRHDPGQLQTDRLLAWHRQAALFSSVAPVPDLDCWLAVLPTLKAGELSYLLACFQE